MGRWAQARRRGTPVTRITYPELAMLAFGFGATPAANWSSTADPASFNVEAQQDYGTGWQVYDAQSVLGNLRTCVLTTPDPSATMIRARVQAMVAGAPGPWTDWLESEL